MKKLLCIVCALLLTWIPLQAEEGKQYELWTQSPRITTGLTVDETRIYKAMDAGTLRLVPLPSLGADYFFAVCENQMRDGGYNGRSDTSNLYLYTLLVTDDNFIILDQYKCQNEYYWNAAINISQISQNVSSAFYTSNGSEMPHYVISFGRKYVNSNWSEYDEYYFITNSGKLYRLSSVANGTERFPVIADGKLYSGGYKYKSGVSTLNYYMPDSSTLAAQLLPMFFKNGEITTGTAILAEQTAVKSQDGYVLYDETKNKKNVEEEIYYRIPNTQDLFFKIEYPAVERAGITYYDLKVSVFRAVQNRLTPLSTLTHQTTRKNVTAAKVYQLDEMNRSFYIGHGISVPAVMLNNDILIGEDGTLYDITLNSTDQAQLSTYYIGTYSGRLCLIHDRDKSTSSYYWKDENGTNRYWQKVHPIYFVDGVMYLEQAYDLPCLSKGNSGQNGYFSGYGKFVDPTYAALSISMSKEWFGRGMDNVFPDGRYVELSWTAIGGSGYELWYNIYHPDGTLRATGPTSYSTTFADFTSKLPLRAIAVNNSKFIATIDEVDSDWMKEYYRVSVVDETDDGEIVEGGVGNKNIVPPEPSDTEPIQHSINFANEDLPLGYNIRDNVIDSTKLETGLREQINAIRLNDIVIITDSDSAKSGQKNTGITLPSFFETVYDFGASIDFRSNGQYLNWYCTEPDALRPGTYPLSLAIGDRTIYITVIIVQPPDSSGTTSVIF